MTDHDTNGFRIKPDHTGVHAPDMGETVWVVKRHDHKLFGPFPTRHAAVGYEATLLSCDDYDIVPVTAGSVRLDDIVRPDGGDGA